MSTAIALLLSGGLTAQQRKPAFEVYGLTGAYFHGNEGVQQWRPQFGAGVLAPLRPNWGLLCDVTTSAAKDSWYSFGQPQADGVIRERRIILTPSALRLWRRERFTVYAGLGVGWEHTRQRVKYRPIVIDADTNQPIIADQFKERSSTDTRAAPLLRIGASISITRKTVLRTGYTVLKRYTDEVASHSFELGVGWRFGD